MKPQIDWSHWAVVAKTNRDVRQWFIQQNDPLARYLAAKHRGHLDHEDAFQAARIGINRAIETFDPSKGAWSTYAQGWVRADVSRARSLVPVVSGFKRVVYNGRPFDESQKLAYQTLSTNETIPGSDVGEEWGTLLRSEDATPEEVFDAQERDDTWTRAILRAGLTHKEKLVLSRIIAGKRQAEAAQELGVTRQRVEQIMRHVEAKLRGSLRRCA